MKLKCCNCGRTADEGDFVLARNPLGRHTMGDIFSDMECPKCGALAFPVTPKLPDYRAMLKSIAADLRNMGVGKDCDINGADAVEYLAALQRDLRRVLRRPRGAA